jgi:hypothetical protein
MNIPHLETVLHNDRISFWSLVLTSILAVASLWFVFYIVGSNWLDYRASILPHRYRRPLTPKTLRIEALRPGRRQDGRVVKCGKPRWIKFRSVTTVALPDKFLSRYKTGGCPSLPRRAVGSRV